MITKKFRSRLSLLPAVRILEISMTFVIIVHSFLLCINLMIYKCIMISFFYSSKIGYDGKFSYDWITMKSNAISWYVMNLLSFSSAKKFTSESSHQANKLQVLLIQLIIQNYYYVHPLSVILIFLVCF